MEYTNERTTYGHNSCEFEIVGYAAISNTQLSHICKLTNPHAGIFGMTKILVLFTYNSSSLKELAFLCTKMEYYFYQ